LLQEYYEEESFRTLYRDVIERLLITLADEPKELSESSPKLPARLVVNGDAANVWPPWPWPPWGGGGDDDGDDGNDQGTPDPRELAEQIVAFESRMAKASLDL
jgi:endothelin-converting enzyme